MKSGFVRYKNRISTLVKQPFFWLLTITGNTVILIGSLLLDIFEAGQPDGPLKFIDCLLWSMGTVTTVGYGNYMPHTLPGKWTIIFLMAFGTLFIWTYMAFLVTGLIAPELASLEKDVHKMEQKIEDLQEKIESGENLKL